MSGTLYTMIAVIGEKRSKPDGYVIADNEYKVKRATVKSVMEALASGVQFTNLEISDNKIVAYNGVISRYPLMGEKGNYDSNGCGYVVMDRLEKKGKLIGYTVIDLMGVAKSISTNMAVQLCNKGMIANAKIFHTNDGDIIGAIKGNTPIKDVQQIERKLGYKGVNILVRYMGTASSNTSQNLDVLGVQLSAENQMFIAKAFKQLSSGANTAKNELNKMSGEGDLGNNTVDVIRMGESGIYMITSLKDVVMLEENGAKVSWSDNCVFSSIDCNEGDIETTVASTSGLKGIIRNIKDGKCINAGTEFSKKNSVLYLNRLKELANKWEKSSK